MYTVLYKQKFPVFIRSQSDLPAEKVKGLLQTFPAECQMASPWEAAPLGLPLLLAQGALKPASYSGNVTVMWTSAVCNGCSTPNWAMGRGSSPQTRAKKS